jgi:hypothetical protein
MVDIQILTHSVVPISVAIMLLVIRTKKYESVPIRIVGCLRVRSTSVYPLLRTLIRSSFSWLPFFGLPLFVLS